MRIYISGTPNETSSSSDPNSYKCLENELLKEGHKIVNDVSTYNPTETRIEDELLHNMELLAGAEAIYFLKDWTTSRKAIIEKLFAELTGKTILFQEEIRNKKRESEQNLFLLLQIEGAVEEVTGMKLTDYRKKRKKENCFMPACFLLTTAVSSFLCQKKSETLSRETILLSTIIYGNIKMN